MITMNINLKYRIIGVLFVVILGGILLMDMIEKDDNKQHEINVTVHNSTNDISVQNCSEILSLFIDTATENEKYDMGCLMMSYIDNDHETSIMIMERSSNNTLEYYIDYLTCKIENHEIM